MHPVIATFLDVRTAIDTLERGVAGVPISPHEAAFVSAAKAHGDLSAYVLQAKGKQTPSDEAQNATILLAVRAALSVIPQDVVLAPAAKKAREALTAAGADPEQIEQLLGGVLVEEAFTGDNDPEHFDLPFVQESFAELPELARLDAERVAAMVDEFAATAKPELKPLQLSCAEVLFQAAWGEGTMSVNVEHVEDSLQILAGDDPTELDAVKTGLEALLRYLAKQRLIGPLRLDRLLGHLAEWSLDDLEEREEDEDEDEDDDLGEDDELDDDEDLDDDDEGLGDDVTGELETPDEDEEKK